MILRHHGKNNNKNIIIILRHHGKNNNKNIIIIVKIIIIYDWDLI